jgi:hypothetical protein
MGVLCAIFYGLFLKRIRRAHFSWVSNVLAVVGLPMFSYLLVRSKVAHREGRVSWKGRGYSAAQAGPSTALHRSSIDEAPLGMTRVHKGE